LGVTRTHDGLPALPGNNQLQGSSNSGAQEARLQENVHTGRMAINSAPRKGPPWGLHAESDSVSRAARSGAKWSTLYADIPEAEANRPALDPAPGVLVTRNRAR